jgi:hypothetical protein
LRNGWSDADERENIAKKNFLKLKPLTIGGDSKPAA